MARLKAKSIDRNRLGKRYPFVRAPKRLAFIADNDVIIELLTATFENESTKTVIFEEPMPDTSFRVAFSPRNTEATDSANVNLYVDDDNTDETKVTILASAEFTGVVDVIVIRVAE